MSGESPQRSSLHSLWISWAPQSRMPFEKVKVTMVALRWVLGLVVVPGETATSTAEAEAKLVRDTTKKVDHRGPSFVRGSTKRKKFTGEDPPGDGDPPRKAIHAGGKFLTMEEYFQLRVFVFLHHFSGKKDNLSEAIQREADERGIKVNTSSCDKVGTGEDLSETYPFGHHLVSAGRGDIDGFHSGFPCHTYSKLLWRQAGASQVQGETIWT